MVDPICELKTRAEILQHAVHRRVPQAVSRLRALSDYRSLSEDRLCEVAIGVRRHECLSLLAIELGFSGWAHAKRTIGGDPEARDFGTILYPSRCGGHLNFWYRDYREATVGQRQCHGYLLGYRRQCFVVQGGFIEALGLDPHRPEWRAIGFDWVRPVDVQARTRLYGELLRQLPAEGARS